MANPFEERVTFDDFLKKYGTKQVQENQKKAEHEMNKKQMQKQVNEAERILHGFKPPQKGGVD